MVKLIYRLFPRMLLILLGEGRMLLGFVLGTFGNNAQQIIESIFLPSQQHFQYPDRLLGIILPEL